MIKEDVSLRGLSPQMALAHTIVLEMYRKHGLLDCCVITSGCDGKHSEGSRHYSGEALDYGVKYPNGIYLSCALAEKLAIDISAALKKDYDVILEYSKYHIHVEFDPK